jgi:hypothetical protein
VAAEHDAGGNETAVPLRFAVDRRNGSEPLPDLALREAGAAEQRNAAPVPCDPRARRVDLGVIGAIELDFAITPAAPARNAARIPASVITGSPDPQITGLRSRSPATVMPRGFVSAACIAVLFTRAWHDHSAWTVYSSISDSIRRPSRVAGFPAIICRISAGV